MLLAAIFALTIALAVQEPAPGTQGEAPKPAVEKARWVRKPSAGLVNKIYPKAAFKAHIGGQVTMTCDVGAKGLLTACAVVSETPSGYGFGEAALKTLGAFQMTETTPDGRSTEGAVVYIPLRFSPD